MRHIPNILTGIRFGMIGFVIYFFVAERYTLALILFVVACLTDVLDGWIARKYNYITDFGKLMDPLADKLMMLSVLGCLLFKGIIGWPLIVIILVRELTMIIGGYFFLKRKNRVVMADKFGKLTALLFNVAVGLTVLNSILHMDAPQEMWRWDQIVLYICAVLSLFSMVHYGLSTIRAVRAQERAARLEESIGRQGEKG